MKNLYTQNAWVFFFFCSLFLLSFNGFAQVGIGTTDPDSNAKLDIVSTAAEPGGLLLPRVALSAINNPAPLSGSITNGMTVYNTATAGTGINRVTPGFYYHDGTEWVRLASATRAENDWGLTGNAGTTVGTHFLGTTDSQALRFRTRGIERFEITDGNNNNGNGGGRLRAFFNGTATSPTYSWNSNSGTGMFQAGTNILGLSTNGTERMRLLSDGRVTVNSQSAYDFMFNSIAAGTNGAIIGASVNGTAVQGQASGTGHGVSGFASNSTGFGIVGVNSSSTGTGLLASGNNSSSNTYLGTGTGTASTGRDGSLGYGTYAAGTGVIGTGNNSPTIVVNSNGGGIAGSGTRNGIFGYAGNGDRINTNRGNSGGVFMLDTDNDTSNNNSNNNNGIRATAILAGFDNIVPGNGSPAADSYFGGYFSGGTENFNWFGNPVGTVAYAYVGLRYNTNNNGTTGTDFKIVGPGSVATLINDDQNVPRIMFAPEAPEIVFQDYGIGQLVNGQATILLDPILKKSLHIDSQHPLKVFVTLEGDCNGVYVANKSAHGFTVKELQNGTSNVPFSWQIVANRADTKDRDGNVVSKHVGLRLPVGPGPIAAQAKSQEIVKSNVIDAVEKEIQVPMPEEDLKRVKISTHVDKTTKSQPLVNENISN